MADEHSGLNHALAGAVTRRFGNTYDEFATFERTLITQFALLVGDSSPDYTEDSLMCLYIVAYVFVCTLSLLNFLLAIVVNVSAARRLNAARPGRPPLGSAYGPKVLSSPRRVIWQLQFWSDSTHHPARS